jgi:vancomycin resistance protein VanW
MWMQHNKIHNLQLAIRELDGVILKPAKALSYWKQIGNPTKRKGYLPGMILNRGNVTAGTGGGLCQLSNLIFWMTIHTPLTVTERWRHGYDVFPDANRTQPFGSGATCYYPFLDLVINNPTAQFFQLHLRIEENVLIGEWRSNQPVHATYRIEERGHQITHTSWGAYIRSNRLIRIKEGDGEETEIAHNEAIMMYEPLLHDGGPGK